MAIDTPEAISLLKKTSPDLALAVDVNFAEWRPEPPPSTVIMGVIGDQIGSSLENYTPSVLSDISATIERLLDEGTEETQNAVATGLLESLLGQSSAGKINFNPIARHLGPKAKAYCRAWDQFTGCETLGLD